MEDPSPVGGALDIVLGSSRVLESKPDEERARITAAVRAPQQVYDLAARAVEQARNSRELTAVGRRAAVARALAQAREQLGQHAATIARMEADVAAARAKAMETPAGERTPEAVSLEREIRDVLRASKEDPLLVAVRYRQAITDEDWTFVRAIEGAPRAFALVTRDVLEQGSLMKLMRSPRAPAIQDAMEVAGLHRFAVRTAETELGKLGEAFGVQADD
jgi:hypothetical protein